MSLRPLLAVCLVLPFSVAAGAAEVPYQAMVSADSVYVRSGPDESYYPTEVLRAGDVVRVLRHGPRGWIAIAPTRESFNWISGRYVRELPNGLLQITGDNVALRVGSDLTSARDVWQQALHRGDTLEMINRVPSDSGVWYRVSPPAGEARWVLGKHLKLHEPEPQSLHTTDREFSPRLLRSAHGAIRSYSEDHTEREPRRMSAEVPSTVAMYRRLEELERRLHELDRQYTAATRTLQQEHGTALAAFQESAVVQPIAPGMALSGPVVADPIYAPPAIAPSLAHPEVANHSCVGCTTCPQPGCVQRYRQGLLDRGEQLTAAPDGRHQPSMPRNYWPREVAGRGLLTQWLAPSPAYPY